MPADQAKLERRAKREHRRALQRAANAGRAEKMHEARLEFEYQPNGNMPSSVASEDKEQQYFIGCSGWFYWHWRGVFYPDGMPTNQWFSHYRQHFKTVELNAPFYSWPTIANVKSWLRQIKDQEFIYTVKVSELITHVKKFTGTKVLVKDFGHIADLLAEHMGCFLFQLPPSFTFTRARLKAIVSQLDPKRRNVVEFRHASWWNDEVYEAFAAAGIIFCSTSGPKLPSPIVKTTDDIYIRFHGTSQWYRHDYPDDVLADWARRIQTSKAKRVWIYFNNDNQGYAIKNAETLMGLLKT